MKAVRQPSVNSRRIILTVLLIFVGMVTACSLWRQDQTRRIPPGYEERALHMDEAGWQDFTDYAWYRYPEDKGDWLRASADYAPVTAADLKKLAGYFENFSRWVAFREGAEQWYDFCPAAQLDTEDYFSLVADGKSSDPYACYDLYYFDTQKGILYFFHSNV